MEYKEKIKSRGLKQKFLAEKLNISEPRLSQYLKGKRSMPYEISKQLDELLKNKE